MPPTRCQKAWLPLARNLPLRPSQQTASLTRPTAGHKEEELRQLYPTRLTRPPTLRVTLKRNRTAPSAPSAATDPLVVVKAVTLWEEDRRLTFSKLATSNPYRRRLSRRQWATEHLHRRNLHSSPCTTLSNP